jgi:hypothetical protein
MAIGRLLMRLLLVPLGGCIAIVVAMVFAMVANWNRITALTTDDPSGMMAFAFVAPAVAIGAALMMYPAILGALIAEAFAIRSWIYHVANGGLSMCFSLATIGAFDKEYSLSEAPLIAVGAGIAGGFAYWLVAGWSAGFWKPVIAPPAPPPTGSPPPASA